MAKRHGGIAVALGAVLAACGGGTSGNAAAGKTFDYGAPQVASSTQTSAVQEQVASAFALRGGSGATDVPGIVQPTSLMTALLGDSGYGVSLLEGTPTHQAALRRATRSVAAVTGSSSGSNGFDDPACVKATGTATASSTGSWSATFSNCTVTATETSGSVRVSVDGFLEGTAETLRWDLTAQVTLSGSDGSGTGKVHASGHLAGTSTTLQGDVLTETEAHASSGGRTIGLGVSESLAVDVAYDPAQSCVTAPSTLEAKRVWTERPSGASATQLPDKAAKVTWTGCGTGTIAFSR